MESTIPVSELFEDITSIVLPTLREYRSRIESIRTDTKSDDTLLTEADLAIQNAIVARCERYFPGVPVVAEEGSRQSTPARGTCWVVDPIDGTREFVRRGGREFCTVVALIEGFRPAGALLVAPELGQARTPLIITADVRVGELRLGGSRIAPRPTPTHLRRVSATRSATADEHPFERTYAGRGVQLKTRTTSQSLDLLRLCADLQAHSDHDLAPFDLFLRRDQHLWDGAAGMVLATLAGLGATDWSGAPLVPIANEVLARSHRFASVALGAGRFVEDFVNLYATLTNQGLDRVTSRQGR